MIPASAFCTCVTLPRGTVPPVRVSFSPSATWETSFSPYSSILTNSTNFSHRTGSEEETGMSTNGKS